VCYADRSLNGHPYAHATGPSSRFFVKNNPASGVNSRLAKRLTKYGRLGDDGFDDVSLVLNARQPGIQTLETIRKPF
jgi:hypothetical protein